MGVSKVATVALATARLSGELDSFSCPTEGLSLSDRLNECASTTNASKRTSISAALLRMLVATFSTPSVESRVAEILDSRPMAVSGSDLALADASLTRCATPFDCRAIRSIVAVSCTIRLRHLHSADAGLGAGSVRRLSPFPNLDRGRLVQAVYVSVSRTYDRRGRASLSPRT